MLLFNDGGRQQFPSVPDDHGLPLKIERLPLLGKGDSALLCSDGSQAPDKSKAAAGAWLYAAHGVRHRVVPS